MKFRFKIKHIVLASVNGAALIAAAVMTAVGSSMAKSQKYNYAASEWGGKKGNYAQISCFFAENSGFSTTSLNSVRSMILSELQTVSVAPEEGKTLVPDAYSSPLGNCQISSDINRHTSAEITAVGGDFFLFRDFTLLDGVYFTKEDLMQDGAVIDRELAWMLYGSENIAGMDMYINGVKFYIAGVIGTPDTKPEKQCAGKTMRAYISYDMADEVTRESASMNTAPDGNAQPAAFDGITCYECIIPNPVDSFAENTMEKIFGQQYDGKVDIVSNGSRFNPKKRTKAYKKLSNSVVQDNGIIYPYWENASRIVEFRLSRLYHGRKLILIIPFLTLAWILLRLIILWRRKKPKLKRYLSLKLDRLRHRIRGIFRRKKKEQE